jgi:hypothetical protein
MGDVGDDFKWWNEQKKEMRAKHGIPCPECVSKLPKANPSILVPGQRCRIHGYRDNRPRIDQSVSSEGKA